MLAARESLVTAGNMRQTQMAPKCCLRGLCDAAKDPWRRNGVVGGPPLSALALRCSSPARSTARPAMFIAGTAAGWIGQGISLVQGKDRAHPRWR
jgi:hypothetical protein